MTTNRPAAVAIGRRALLVSALGVAVLAACADEKKSSTAAPADDPRPLTSQEAELLALARFRLHQRATVPVDMEWPGTPSASLAVTLDLHDGVAWGRMSTGDDDAATDRLVLWDLQAIGTAPSADEAPAPAEWSTRGLSTDVPQDIFLTLALTLGSDRPENPVLLQQSTAQFLRRDAVGGVETSVFQGPRPAEETEQRQARSRYWVDDEGALLRFEAYLGDRSGQLARITLTDPHDEVEGLREAAEGVLVAGRR